MEKFIKLGMIILIGWGLYQTIAFIFLFDNIYPEEIELTGIAKVVSMKTEKTRSNSYIVKIMQSNLKNTKNTKLIIYTTKDCDLKYGDIIQISGTFSKAEVARNYKGFSYRNYLKQSKVYGSLYSQNTKILNHDTSLIGGIFQFKGVYPISDGP